MSGEVAYLGFCSLISHITHQSALLRYAFATSFRHGGARRSSCIVHSSVTKGPANHPINDVARQPLATVKVVAVKVVKRMREGLSLQRPKWKVAFEMVLFLYERT